MDPAPEGADQGLSMMQSNFVAVGVLFLTTTLFCAQEAGARSRLEHGCLSRSYLTFFESNSVELNAAARAIVKDLADAIEILGISKVELIGHADRAGSARFNMALSHRRAEAVKAALLELGVKIEIVVTAKGESTPLVPTPDDVQEPQNRRVEAIFP